MQGFFYPVSARPNVPQQQQRANNHVASLVADVVDNEQEGEPRSCRTCRHKKQGCCSSLLATLVWLSFLLQLLVVVFLSLLCQNVVTCAWDDLSSSSSSSSSAYKATTTNSNFCLPLPHHFVRQGRPVGLIALYFLAIVWLVATSCTYMLVVAGQFCCQSSRLPVDEEQQYPPIYEAHNNNTMTSLSYWSTATTTTTTTHRHGRHDDHLFRDRNNRINNNNRQPYSYYRSFVDEPSPPTVASSSWEDSDEDSSNESTPLVVYLV